ncbi:MAG: helix-turn-helix domain-containing protein [Lachnospiraceae bacterium]
MNVYEKMGQLIRQAREEKGWTHQELADKMGIDEDAVKGHEEGDGSLMTDEAIGYCNLLNISCDIAIYEENVEDALRMERICRELLELSQEQFIRVVKAAGCMRK